MRRLLLSFAVLIIFAAPAQADNHRGLTVYSYLTPTFIQPALDAFERETGVPIAVEYMTAGQLLSRLKEENANPKADVVFHIRHYFIIII